MILYKRNAKGQPISWSISALDTNTVKVEYGIVGKNLRCETYSSGRLAVDEMKTAINEKRKDGYKELKDLYDNAPIMLPTDNLLNYLNTYLPKDNTHADGSFIPMLCKTLKDNKPFTKGHYMGQWKINGERCIITATMQNDMFNPVKLHYMSRKGIDWTNKLSYLDEYLIPILRDSEELLDIMIEEGVGLDGELYIPGYGINEINSFIKNTDLPQHYLLQFWCYDLCIPDMSAIARYCQLESYFNDRVWEFKSKDSHLNNKERLLLLPSYNDINNISDAIRRRDQFIDLGFEGLVIREESASYQFGGKRNNSMLKFKKIEDGKFEIMDIVPEGKRTNLPKFICKNDINNELFEVTLNATQDRQEYIFQNKDKYIGLYMLVEYRERSGIKQVPFHAKGIEIYDN